MLSLVFWFVRSKLDSIIIFILLYFRPILAGTQGRYQTFDWKHLHFLGKSPLCPMNHTLERVKNDTRMTWQHSYDVLPISVNVLIHWDMFIVNQ